MGFGCEASRVEMLSGLTSFEVQGLEGKGIEI